MPEIDDATMPLIHFSNTIRLAPSYQKIITNDRATVVLWDDGSKTRATCAPEDLFDPKIGFAICLMKKLYPKRQRERILKKVEVQNARDHAG